MKLRTKYFIIAALGRLSWDDKAQIKARRQDAGSQPKRLVPINRPWQIGPKQAPMLSR